MIHEENRLLHKKLKDLEAQIQKVAILMKERAVRAGFKLAAGELDQGAERAQPVRLRGQGGRAAQRLREPDAAAALPPRLQPEAGQRGDGRRRGRQMYNI